MINHRHQHQPTYSSSSSSHPRPHPDAHAAPSTDESPSPGKITGGSGTVRKPKRKRSMIACKNCNERRVRCDGATNGLPCSNCKYAGKGGCAFIESRRVRGARGRFESKDGQKPSSPSTSQARMPTVPSAPRHARRHSITGTDGDEWRRLPDNSAAVDRSTVGPITYPGESCHINWSVNANGAGEIPPTPMLDSDGMELNRVNKDLLVRGAYDLPRPALRDALIAAYFEVAHPMYPIICRRTFMQAIYANTFSHQLVQAVLVVGATHADWALLQREGYASRREAVDCFYAKARMLFDGDAEPDKLANIQTMFLLQFWWRAVTDHRDPLWWLAGAIRMAQNMGLHRSTSRSKLESADRKNWKRVWWMLYLRDRQASSHFGKPTSIKEEDCDIEELEVEDLEVQEGNIDEEKAMYIVQTLKLAQFVDQITICVFSPGATLPVSTHVRMREACHARLSSWQRSLPQSLIYTPSSVSLYSLYLQLSFLGLLLMLNRPAFFEDTTLPLSMRVPSSRIATGASSAITAIVNTIVENHGARYMSVHYVTCLCSAMTIQTLGRRDEDPNRAANADSMLRQNLRFLTEFEKILPMAEWLRDRFQRVLDAEVVATDKTDGRVSAGEAFSEGGAGGRVVPPSSAPVVQVRRETEHADEGLTTTPPPPPPNQQQVMHERQERMSSIQEERRQHSQPHQQPHPQPHALLQPHHPIEYPQYIWEPPEVVAAFFNAPMSVQNNQVFGGTEEVSGDCAGAGDDGSDTGMQSDVYDFRQWFFTETPVDVNRTVWWNIADGNGDCTDGGGQHGSVEPHHLPIQDEGLMQMGNRVYDVRK